MPQMRVKHWLEAAAQVISAKQTKPYQSFFFPQHFWEKVGKSMSCSTLQTSNCSGNMRQVKDPLCQSPDKLKLAIVEYCKYEKVNSIAGICR